MALTTNAEGQTHSFFSVLEKPKERKGDVSSSHLKIH